MTLEERKKELFSVLCPERAFDLRWREFEFAGQRGAVCYLAGFADSGMLEKILNTLMTQENPVASAEEVLLRALPAGDATIVTQNADFANEILKGHLIFFAESFSEALSADLKHVPDRGNEEPQKNRTLRGPHLGFNETMTVTITLVRRYLRSPRFSAELFTLGTEVQNDAAILYVKGRADEKALAKIREKLKNARPASLAMTQDAIVKILFPQKGPALLDPFPRVRYTERPDVVAATLLEGKIAVVCDNTPSVILLPECVFDFFEEADDYYFPSVTASYLRAVRAAVFVLSVLLVPSWLLFAKHQEFLPAGWNFVVQHDEMAVPLFLQCLIIELALDGLRMASLNTPDPLANSFSVVGGLLLGDFAVKSGWFIPQTILYSSFTAIANFVPTNYELGYSFKFTRISLILLVQFFDWPGLLGGILFWTGVLFFTRSVSGRRYLYPFLPFDPAGIRRIVFKGTRGRESRDL